MADKQTEKQPDTPSNALPDKISQNVLLSLGRPPNLMVVQVRHLWSDRYRVNVLITDGTSAKIAHSYFVVVDVEGKVITSSPKIVKQYNKPEVKETES